MAKSTDIGLSNIMARFRGKRKLTLEEALSRFQDDPELNLPAKMLAAQEMRFIFNGVASEVLTERAIRRKLRNFAALIRRS